MLNMFILTHTLQTFCFCEWPHLCSGLSLPCSSCSNFLIPVSFLPVWWSDCILRLLDFLSSSYKGYAWDELNERLGFLLFSVTFIHVRCYKHTWINKELHQLSFWPTLWRKGCHSAILFQTWVEECYWLFKIQIKPSVSASRGHRFLFISSLLV